MIDATLTDAEQRSAALIQQFCAYPPEALATTDMVAAYLGCSKAKLERDRWAGGGIPFKKISRSVRYKKADVLAYLECCPRLLSTSGKSAGGQ
jgi:hypothetical protein